MTQSTFSAASIPSGEELYNKLMAGIEPELLTQNLPTLEEKYKNESPEDAKARAAKYDKAFAEYEKQLAAYMSGMQRQVTTYKRTALQSAEAEDRTRDRATLQSLETEFSS